MKESEYLEKLEEMTNELPHLVTTDSIGYIEYSVGDGTAIGFNLYNSGEVAVQRTFLTKGSVFPEHVHPNEIEIFIVYRGKGKCITPDGEKEFVVGDCIRINKGIPHSLIIFEDTWLIGITIPAAEGYPTG